MGGRETGDIEYTEAHVTSIAASQELDRWKAFIHKYLEGAVPSATCASRVACVLRVLQEGVAASPHFVPFAIEAGALVLNINRRSGSIGTASNELLAMRRSLAEWCVVAGDECQARRLWSSMLPASDDVTSLQIATMIIDSSLRTHDYMAAESECLRGVALCRALSASPAAADTVNHFLHSVGSIFASRHRFTDASQRFSELYERTHEVEHLRLAVICTIQSDACPTRTQRLRLYRRDKSAASLGDLYNILCRAAHPNMLRLCDLERFLEHTGASTDEDVASVRKAFAQHNLEVISKVYCNIRLAELGRILGVSAVEMEELVARMVSERRLSATLDQVTEIVTFDHEENTSNVERWNEKIGLICDELSCAVDLIVSRHPEQDEGHSS
uniref:COP9 signalosome complex subunit 4 n=1 Tax=Trypanosoma congolense (strain IL3000) TaxID=1068625 RepID=G0UWX6_TRYCI|nr:putative cop9 signalosome complex subunit [Trypanosoma congolense IL3000]